MFNCIPLAFHCHQHWHTSRSHLNIIGEAHGAAKLVVHLWPVQLCRRCSFGIVGGPRRRLPRRRLLLPLLCRRRRLPLLLSAGLGLGRWRLLPGLPLRLLRRGLGAIRAGRVWRRRRMLRAGGRRRALWRLLRRRRAVELGLRRRLMGWGLVGGGRGVGLGGPWPGPFGRRRELENSHCPLECNASHSTSCGMVRTLCPLEEEVGPKQANHSENTSPPPPGVWDD